jgi:prepilin-type N-terminal cleavage/methylation domain-containing protein
MGFTLAELLICIVILGVIATFTIPKLLQTQQSQRKLATSKEAIGILSEAFMKYKLQAGITPGVSVASDLFPYINYVKIDTSGALLDNYPLFPGSVTCSNSRPCLRLHTGAVIVPNNADWYAANPNNAISFTVDPDGAYTGDSDSVDITLYYDGGVRSRTVLRPNTEYAGGVIRGPQANADPTWFRW